MSDEITACKNVNLKHKRRDYVRPIQKGRCYCLTSGENRPDSWRVNTKRNLQRPNMDDEFQYVDKQRGKASALFV